MNILVLALALYLALVNVAGLFFVGQDKLASRTSNNGERRTPEGLLFFLAIIGGSVGVYTGMFLFRHKTQKIYFLVGIPILLAQQIWLLSDYVTLFVKEFFW